MVRQPWCLAAWGLVCSVFFLATQSPAAPLPTLLYVLAMLGSIIWLKAPGGLAVFAAALFGDFFLSPFPWTLLFAQASVAFSFAVAKALFARKQEEAPVQTLPPKIEVREVIKEVIKEVPVIKEITTVIEVPVETEEAMKRLRLLNEVRADLWEKELLVQHLLEKSAKQVVALPEPKEEETLETKEENNVLHPAEIAYRELRKQFVEKADALHRMRQQMFALEGEFIVFKREQEEADGQTTERLADLMQALGVAEREFDQLEEHVLSLQQHVNHPLPKKPVRRKKAEAIAAVQAELFEPVAKVTVARNRKKRSTSSVYFGEIK